MLWPEEKSIRKYNFLFLMNNQGQPKFYFLLILVMLLGNQKYLAVGLGTLSIFYFCSVDGRNYANMEGQSCCHRKNMNF